MGSARRCGTGSLEPGDLVRNGGQAWLQSRGRQWGLQQAQSGFDLSQRSAVWCRFILHSRRGKCSHEPSEFEFQELS